MKFFQKLKLAKGLINQINFGNALYSQTRRTKSTWFLYEVENIDSPCYVTLAVNPKEYFEYFKSESVNKKHKGIEKGASGMEFKNYAERIKPLNQFDKFQKSKIDSKNEVRISVKKGEMLTHKIRKNKFSQLNDKRFYFPNSVIFFYSLWTFFFR